VTPHLGVRSPQPKFTLGDPDIFTKEGFCLKFSDRERHPWSFVPEIFGGQGAPWTEIWGLEIFGGQNHVLVAPPGGHFVMHFLDPCGP